MKEFNEAGFGWERGSLHRKAFTKRFVLGPIGNIANYDTCCPEHCSSTIPRFFVYRVEPTFTQKVRYEHIV